MFFLLQKYAKNYQQTLPVSHFTFKIVPFGHFRRIIPKLICFCPFIRFTGTRPWALGADLTSILVQYVEAGNEEKAIFSTEE